MAGHNFSRYMSSIWSALFAPFHLSFYTRLWCFFAQLLSPEKAASAFLPTTRPSSPSSSSPTSPSSSSFLKSLPPTIASPVPPPPTTSAPSPVPTPDHSTDTSVLSRPPLTSSELPTDPSPAGLADNTFQRYDLLNDATGFDDLSQDSDSEQAIDMAKKRNGRGGRGGRGGGRGGAQPSVRSVNTVTPAGPVTPVTPALTTATNGDANQGWPASAHQSEGNLSGNTNTMKHGSVGNGNAAVPVAVPVPGDGLKLDSTVPPQTPCASNKENIPTQHNGAAPRPQPGSLAPIPLALMNNRSEPQNSGTRSGPTVGHPSTTTASNTMDGADPERTVDVEQLQVLANQLTLDDVQPTGQPAQQTPTEPTDVAATTDASTLPNVTVVEVPIHHDSSDLGSSDEEEEEPILPGEIEPETKEGRAAHAIHIKFMREAIKMGDLALKTNETPVGCVLVHNGRIIAKGMNATNVTRNGTRHAEFMALTALLSRRPSGGKPMTTSVKDLDDADWDAVDPRDGHVYPYGQKFHPSPVVDRSLIPECILYVTVEPCVMCASLLRQVGIKKVYFGAVNDKFGGTGGVLRIHRNTDPVYVSPDEPFQQSHALPILKFYPGGKINTMKKRKDDLGDGGNVEAGYPVEGGYLRVDAVSLLRRFYVQENGRAPQPRKKEGRAARYLASIAQEQGAVNSTISADNNTPDNNTRETPGGTETPDTPVDGEQQPAGVVASDAKADPIIDPGVGSGADPKADPSAGPSA